MGQSSKTVQADYYLFTINGVYYVKFRDPITRELLSKKSTGLKNKTLATQWAQKEWEQRVIDCTKSDILFRDYAAPFFTEECPHLAELKAVRKTMAVKTRRNYRAYLEKYIATDPIADKELGFIERKDAIAFRDRLNLKFGYTRTAQLVLQVFKVIIHTALNAGVIDSDPVHKVTTSVANEKIRTAITLEGIKNLFEPQHWGDTRLRLAVMTAGIVGLRAGEVRGLKWKDIDPMRDIIRISRSINDLEGEKDPKWGKHRITPYPYILKKQLEPLRADGENWVFAVSSKGPLSYKVLSKAMKEAVKKAGIETITLHGLRHSIQTALRGSGVNPELLRATFGWSNESTQEGYTHRELYNLAPQKEITDELFGEKKMRPHPRYIRKKR